MNYINKIDGRRSEELTALSDAITQGLFQDSAESDVAFTLVCDTETEELCGDRPKMSQKKCRFCD